MSSSLKTLISHLNPVCRQALENAAGLCVAQTHYNVEVEHLLVKLVDTEGTDCARILRYFKVDTRRLEEELQRALERFDRGNSRTPAMSPQVPLLLREAWLVAGLELGQEVVRSGALIMALVRNDLLRATLLTSAPSLAKISLETLEESLAELIHGSAEDGEASARGSGGTSRSGTSADPGPASTKALDRYTVDLTAQARAGRIDPIRGRDAEIRQVIDVLTRRRQNNPILVGDAGVGKTAVVEGFALRVAAGEVPSSLKEISVRSLDLGLLQAGAGVRGEFEERLKSVIREVEEAPVPVILFIDEAHTLIGTGASAGHGDAANLLKPALARGEFRSIAATTWSEYKRYFEKDPALARRFQVVKVEEPGEEAALEMLRGIARNLERHHGVRILDEALRDAVRLSGRYISERRLPDKAISVLDTACARVALAQEGKPPALEDVERQRQRIETELAILEREQRAGTDHASTIDGRREEIAALDIERADLEAWWHREKELVGRIHRLERQAEGGSEEDSSAGQPAASSLGELRAELSSLQGREPMVPVCVDSQVVAGVVSAWTGVPLGRLDGDEVQAVLRLEERLGERIVGQPQALKALGRRIKTSRAGLEDPGKPQGVFLLVGPTGVGKTETALALAEVLFGGEKNVVSVNMSEFQEAHSMATLKGSPPGYVGFGSGGVLTEAVRRRPYSVVLLDEIEKAHRDVAELFYQVFDKGVLEDGEGVPVDFRNTVILLTSNVGARAIQDACRSGATRPTPEALLEALEPELRRQFQPAFLGRLIVVPYYPLGPAEVREIVRLKLEAVGRRIAHNHKAELSFDEALVESVAERSDVALSGARNIDHILTETLLPELSGRILERLAKGEEFSKIHISVDEMGRFV